MCHRVVRLPPASSFSFFLLLLQDASDSLRTHLRQLRASAGKLALHGAVDPRAGTKLARRGKIETGLGAKQSTAVLGYPINLVNEMWGRSGIEAQEEPAPSQKPQGRGTQRCLVAAGIDFVCCANATLRRGEPPAVYKLREADGGKHPLPKRQPHRQISVPSPCLFTSYKRGEISQ
jgi:hypothetical protein